MSNLSCENASNTPEVKHRLFACVASLTIQLLLLHHPITRWPPSSAGHPATLYTMKCFAKWVHCYGNKSVLWESYTGLLLISMTYLQNICCQLSEVYRLNGLRTGLWIATVWLHKCQLIQGLKVISFLLLLLVFSVFSFPFWAIVCKNLCGRIFPCKVKGTFVASRSSPIKTDLCFAFCRLSRSLSLPISLSLSVAFSACHRFKRGWPFCLLFQNAEIQCRTKM